MTRSLQQLIRAAVPCTLTLVVWTSVAIAMPRLTISDDDIACPGGCDVHVVFHPTLNGTAFAHAPASKPGVYDKCVPNADCRLCFDGANSCMTVMYRGDGPHPRSFDFTPAFYEASCTQPDAPQAVIDYCRTLGRATRSLDGRLNCIRAPDHPSCAATIAAAHDAQARDRPAYAECRRLGASAFNESRSAGEQRSDDCAYERNPTATNSQGKTFRRLLPAGCRDGTFVAPNGTDCCTGNVFADGPHGAECGAFYPTP